MMMESEEISGTLLLDSTDVITALIVARSLDMDRVMPTFQQDGTQDSTKRLSRICRADSMMKVRDEMMRMKDLRKPEGARSVMIEDFQDLEIMRVARRYSSRRRETRGLQSSDVIQDKNVKIQVVGSEIEALYIALEAIEVAQIVYKSIMESEVKWSGLPGGM